VAIGDHLGLDPEALRTLRRAGLLHDVGKLGLSNAILDKPGRLTAAEFAQVRMHPHYSQRILSGTAAFADIVEPAASHHERLDGKGYHRGLGGRDLSLLTRCLTVADVFEALIADRPYRGPMEVPGAMSILRADAGTVFDPVCVSALEASPDRLAEPEPAMSETPVLGLH
jgi:HD-GYP domain-containing protein (c-di-GMP phosphodiesterase class II)